MKRTDIFFRIFGILLCCLFYLTACGREEDGPSGAEGLPSFPDGINVDVVSKEETFYDVASVLENGRFLGMQIWQGEPVQLWMSAPGGENGEGLVSVYMYRKDGTREVCIERIDEDTARMINIRDSEGCCYTVSGEPGNKKIARLDSDGRVQYIVPLGGSLWDICALADGRLALLTTDGNSSAGGYTLSLLDSEGKLSPVLERQKASYVLGVSEDGLLLIDGDEVYRVNLMDGTREKVFSFRQTAYVLRDLMVIRDIEDFYMKNNYTFTILRADRRGSARCETIALAAQDKSRKDVTLRGLGTMGQNFWLKERIQEFNNSQEEYRVVIDAYEEGRDLDAFVTTTGVELATGRGPEILVGSGMVESVSGLIDKGILMDLAPLMEQSGLKEEDYFPLTFDMWRTGEGIYCVFYDMWVQERLMSTAVLGNVREPSIDQLADAMLAYPEPAVYGTSSATEILTELLQGSETLWGMVDWEKGTCDFGGELFGKLLEVAKRYQYDKRNNYPKLTSTKSASAVNTIYFSFRTRAEDETGGYAPVGFLFDDGRHPVPVMGQYRSRLLMLNANAANRDGAWEFVRFLLSEDAQEKLTETLDGYMPVKRSVFEALMEKEMAEGPADNLAKEGMVFQGSLTRERVDEIEAFFESARALPYRTEPILELIQEESREYFNGSKSIEQVADSIENRVQMYLNEQRR